MALATCVMLRSEYLAQRSTCGTGRLATQSNSGVNGGVKGYRIFLTCINLETFSFFSACKEEEVGRRQEEEMGRQHTGMDRPEVRQVPELSLIHI